MCGKCAMKVNYVMEYFKPGEQMRMMYYSLMTQACHKVLTMNRLLSFVRLQSKT